MPKILFIFLPLILCLSFLLAGCETVNNPTNNNEQSGTATFYPRENDNTDSTQIAGGAESRIVGAYSFNTYNEFKEFYEIFIDYNIERYLVPFDAKDKFIFEYKFVSEGVNLTDYNNKKIDIVFNNQTMYVNITYKSNKNYRVEGVCLAKNETIKSYNINYKITENDGKILAKDDRKLLLNIYSDNELIYVGKFDNLINIDLANEVSKELLNYFIINNT